MPQKWKTDTLDTLRSQEEVLRVLMELQERNWMSRGHSQCREKLVPSIDRDSLAGLPRSEKLQYERQSIDLFRATARFFSSDGEQGSLRDDFVALMLLRHHGVPTRLLDWSASPHVAAYFAVSGHDELDGEIWSFSYKDYVIEGKKQWQECPETTIDDSGKDDKFAAGLTAFSMDEPCDWIIVASYPPGFPRQNAQLGHYSMTARFGVDHSKKLKTLLGKPDRYHRYVIKANLKRPLRTTLREKHGIWRGSLFPDTAGAAETAREAFRNTLVTSSEALAIDVSCSKDELTVTLDDGRTVSVPLAWFPRLLNAGAKQRKKWELIGGGIGIHWEEVDEDISVASLLQPEKFMRSADQAMQPAPRSTRTGRKAVPSARKKRSPRRG